MKTEKIKEKGRSVENNSKKVEKEIKMINRTGRERQAEYSQTQKGIIKNFYTEIVEVSKSEREGERESGGKRKEKMSDEFYVKYFLKNS